MIAGSVTADLLPTIRIRFRASGQPPTDLDALVDTGFNGHLTLPNAAISAMGLTQVSSSRVVLADGTVVLLPLYEAHVEWDGQTKRVEADGADNLCLVGTALMEGYDLTVRIEPGGSVLLTPIP